MKRVLSADFFDLRKSRTVYLLPLFAVLLGGTEVCYTILRIFLQL